VGEWLHRILEWQDERELLDREILYSLKEAQALIEMWRNLFNIIRPLSSLGYKPPAPATVLIQPSQIHQVGPTL
jgi:putative transposase